MTPSFTIVVRYIPIVILNLELGSDTILTISAVCAVCAVLVVVAFSVLADDEAEWFAFTSEERAAGMVFVTDENRNKIGIITMEDLLEELVGDIQDESDTGEGLELPERGM